MRAGAEGDFAPGPGLAARLRGRVAREGPLTFGEWMGAALYDGEQGYYRREGAARWGREGDYRTSPESSPLFAATFARHFAEIYERLGRPREFHVIEAGGGAGHFALGVLRTLARDHPRVFDSLKYYFDEASADARRRAVRTLGPYARRVEFRRLEEIKPPGGAAIVFSNELLDALPVHRVVMRRGRLREMFVGVGERGRFVWVEFEPSSPLLSAYFESQGVELLEGQSAEVNLEAGMWVERAARVVGRGYVFTVDYGDEAAGLYGPPERRGGTLRAFRRHRPAGDVLADPGEQDITATVNWTHISAAGERAGLRRVSLEPLDKFLLRAGLLEQLGRECTCAHDAAEVARLRLGAREMVLPGGMASRFQVLVQVKA